MQSRKHQIFIPAREGAKGDRGIGGETDGERKERKENTARKSFREVDEKQRRENWNAKEKK